jgi:hypothetical protein
VRVKYWEIIALNIKKAGWSWGCVSARDFDIQKRGRFRAVCREDWRDYRVVEAAIGRSELISKPWTNPPMHDVRVSSWSSGSQKL